MASKKRIASSALRATLIGDVVGSRRIADRRAQHASLNKALRAIATTAIDAPAFTVGDEFQGSYPTVGRAIDAALSLKLAMAPGVDIRFGIGWGAVMALDESASRTDRVGGLHARPSSGPPLRSGNPAWRWCARRFGPSARLAMTSTRSTPP
jgi:hypothetical protein